MKSILLLSIIIIIYLTSCIAKPKKDVYTNKSEKETETEITLNTNCVEEFNKLFMDIFKNDLSYKISEAKLITPKLIPDFYSKKEVNTFCFFKLSNDSSEFVVAFDTVNTNGNHKLYFCFDFKDYKYIDQSSNVIGDFNSLSCCGLNFANKSKYTKNGWTHNIWDERLMNKWHIDSVQGNSKYSSIEITKKTLILNISDTIEYYQSAFEIFKKSDSTLIFERQAVSNKKLILKEFDNEKEIFYYLSEK